MAGLEVESLAPLHGPEVGAEDWVFEISITPNRGDCLSILGLAREVAALTDKPAEESPQRRPSKATHCLGDVGIKIVNPDSARVTRPL